MEHKIIAATWKSPDSLFEIIQSHESEQWSVAALGEVFGGDVLVLVKDGSSYEHELVKVLFKTREKIKSLIAEKEADRWQVCALGECFGSSILILKRQLV